MSNIPAVAPRGRYARAAGALYLIIIVLGIFSEVGVRSQLVVRGDAAATAANIIRSEMLFRIGFVSDVVVFLCDVAVAALLFVLLRPVNRTLSLVAAGFRLTGTAIYGVNLLNQMAALLLATGGPAPGPFTQDQSQALALFFMDVHRHGYDLGLVFFGVHCLVLGYLLARSASVPRILGVFMVLAGAVYIVGSFTLFLFPLFASAVAPFYAVPLIGELALCGWLLVKAPGPFHRGFQQ